MSDLNFGNAVVVESVLCLCLLLSVYDDGVDFLY